MKKLEIGAALAELAASFRANASIFVPREIGLVTMAALKAGIPISVESLLAEFEARLAAMAKPEKSAISLERIEVEEVIAALRGLRPT